MELSFIGVDESNWQQREKVSLGLLKQKRTNIEVDGHMLTRRKKNEHQHDGDD